MSSKFDMKDLNAAKFILGMEIRRDRANRMNSVNQRKNVEMVLQIFNMQESNLIKVPIPIVVIFSIE